MKAQVKSHNVKNAIPWTRRMVLHAGAKGTGRELFAVRYWPESGPSCEEAERAMSDYIRRHGIEVTPSEDWRPDEPAID